MSPIQFSRLLSQGVPPLPTVRTDCFLPLPGPSPLFICLQGPSFVALLLVCHPSFFLIFRLTPNLPPCPPCPPIFFFFRPFSYRSCIALSFPRQEAVILPQVVVPLSLLCLSFPLDGPHTPAAFTRHPVCLCAVSFTSGLSLFLNYLAIVELMFPLLDLPLFSRIFFFSYYTFFPLLASPRLFPPSLYYLARPRTVSLPTLVCSFDSLCPCVFLLPRALPIVPLIGAKQAFHRRSVPVAPPHIYIFI